MRMLSFLGCFIFSLSGLSAQVIKDSVYTESDIDLNTPTGIIRGSLTVPRNTGGATPVVLIIAGSGPTNRDCNSPGGINTNSYKMLAEGFAANGISTVRFDKRGVAKSRPAATSENNLRFETYIDDAVAWINFLKTDKRFSKIIVLGHSEGSLIGMCAVQQTSVTGLISVAGVAQPADIVLKEQLKGKLSDALTDASNSILDSLHSGKTVSNVPPDLISLYRASVQPYLISYIKYDPSAEIGKLKIPILLVQGTTDIQVKPEQVKLLFAAKPDAKVLILENMNHILKECESDYQKNVATYTNPELPLKAGLVEGLVEFIKSCK